MNDMIIDTMASYNTYIENVPKGCQIIADLMREDKLVEAFSAISNFSEGVGWLVDVNHLLKQRNHSIKLDPQQIHDFLNEVNLGLERQDYVLVADMFEYEIKPYFEECNIYEINEIR